MASENIPTSTIVDLTDLKEILGDDVDGYIQIIEIFLLQNDEKVISLMNGVKNNDFITIKNTAHFLKSSFTMMGLQCKDVLSEIENLSTEEIAMNRIVQLCKQVEKNYTISALEYQKILSYLKASLK